MKFYLQSRNGNIEEITEGEARELLGKRRFDEGIEAKKADPLEEVSYMAGDGFVIIDF